MNALPQPRRPVLRPSLIVTTYNWPEALHLTLASVARQSRLPAEVLIADDGSGPTTAAVVTQWKNRLPLLHVWQEDLGFRLARVRNKAVAAATGEYIILVDGDMILHSRFIEDHIDCARHDCFIQGARPRLSETVTQRLLGTGQIDASLFSPGMEHRPYALRSVLLSRLTSRIRARLGGIQGCNQSFWRDHIVQVNGYDERFTGWGPEDKEFAARLLHIGVKRNYIRHRAVAFHLHHTTRAPLGVNPFERLLEETLQTHSTRCTHGLDAHALPAREQQRDNAMA